MFSVNNWYSFFAYELLELLSVIKIHKLFNNISATGE